MKTALQALKEHRAEFWKSPNPSAFMATESQLIAYTARQIGTAKIAVAETAWHDSYAREIMGIRHEDQFYV